MMGALDKFLSNLVNYDKENVHPDSIKELYSKYLVDPEFDPEFVMSKSSAAAGLSLWNQTNLILRFKCFLKAQNNPSSSK